MRFRFFALIGRHLPTAAVTAILAGAAHVHAAAVKWQPQIEVAAGEAHRGPWRMNESDFRFVDDPTVSINEQGFIAVAWVDQARKDIFFQRYSPDGKPAFKEPMNVSNTPEIFSWLPRMVMTSGEEPNIYILWQEIVFSGGSHGGEIFFARSQDGGRSFGKPVNLSGSRAGDGKGRLTRDSWHNGSLDLAVNGRDIYASWTEYEGTLWFSRSRDGGASFAKPVRVAGGDDEKPARGPSLAVAGNGTIHIAWTVGEDSSADIHLATSKDGGESFGKPRVLFQTDAHDDAPKIAVDEKGTLHLVYAESVRGPKGSYHVRYARSTNAGEKFEKPKELPHPHGSEGAGFPSLSLDQANNVYVIAELFPTPADRSRGLGFTCSTDGGSTFAPMVVIPASIDPAGGFNGSQQGLLMKKLAVNDAGAIAVVNSAFRRGEASRVWLIRGQLFNGEPN
jgi:hypothetical protein